MAPAESQGMLSKGLVLLQTLGDHPRGATATDIARATTLAVSTVHRLLHTMAERGFVSFDPSDKTYRLGVRVFELATKVSGVLSVAETARPLMRELSRRTGETVQLSVLSNSRALFIEKIGTEHAVGIRGSVGESEPLYATSTGKVLLGQLDPERLASVLDEVALDAWTANTVTDRARLTAELDRVRSDDFATANEEFDPGVRAIAVPVRNGRAETIAALCISAPVFRVSQDRMLGWLPELRETAAAIGVRLPLSAALF
ncbi:IclR family transcriptional regulator [Nocardia jinanensis]|uniref:Glycerol operon regulatory protein n=1 Tax=Nocardia jinanensis TaxID=382504 RepID=A0A917RUD3_9NOCA|nr:IclR family transcriptional regulator [Nocardia jinanensis]GGL31242.1 IclR family transcriptional regulator [Nocardia jinanensis]